MFNFPKLKALRTKQETVSVFRGYDRNVRIKEGAFRDMRNLTGDHYPVMAVRKRRKLHGSAAQKDLPVTGMVNTERMGMIYTQGDTLYYYGGMPAKMGLNEEPKQFVTMGHYLIILPDMKYFDLESPQNFGPIGHVVDMLEGTVTFEPCDVEGNVYADATVSDSAPANPADKTMWIDTSLGNKVLKQYSKNLGEWFTIDRTYVKIGGLDDGADGQWFNQYDGVTIRGINIFGADHLNGMKILYGQSNKSLIIEGLIDKKLEQNCDAEGPIHIERKVPVMDYVVEAGNRLWGCRYGMNATGEDPYNVGEFVNKIYASKLGDFRNWECFMGLASDSWDCDVGSQGAFTGAANVAGYPVFYKADMRHKVWINDTGAHQVTATPCQGVKYGCGGSVASMEGAAIFKSRRGFCVDDGSGPEEIGDCFAEGEFSKAIGCVCGHKYFVSMENDEGWHLFVYDADKNLWHREDDFHATAMWGNSVCAIAADADTKELVDISGNSPLDRYAENAVSWMAETGEIGLDSPERKYITRLTLRLSMEVGAELTVYAQYDTQPEWVSLGSIQGTGLQSFSLPLRLRRCDHLRLRLEGEGDVKLYSITKTIQEGSEFP